MNSQAHKAEAPPFFFKGAKLLKIFYWVSVMYFLFHFALGLSGKLDVENLSRYLLSQIAYGFLLWILYRVYLSKSPKTGVFLTLRESLRFSKTWYFATQILSWLQLFFGLVFIPAKLNATLSEQLGVIVNLFYLVAILAILYNRNVKILLIRTKDEKLLK